MPTIRILSGSQIREAVAMADIIDAMEIAFTELSAGRAEMPIRSQINLAEPEGTALFMPSYLKPTGMIGVKTVTLFEDNRKNDIPYIQGMVNLYDGRNGSPKAVLDAMTITALRTGAVSGLATRLLARKDSKVCGSFGAGVQDRTQLEAVCAVRPIQKAYVFDPFPAAAEKFAVEMAEKLGIEVLPAATSAETVGEADIICCATVSKTPVFRDSEIRPGVHINAVGSYKPHVQEVPAEMILRARLYVDHRESALEETGDLIIPIRNGLFTTEHIIGEIGELALGKVKGRTADSEITFFKSVGVAVQDLAASKAVLDRAEQLHIGTVAEI